MLKKGDQNHEKRCYRTAGEHVETSAASQRKKTHHIAVAAMLTAVAFVLQFIEFPIPIMPSFVKLDISDLPALLGTFSLGPVYGVAIQLAKNIIHLPFGSSAGVGELCNFILGAVSSRRVLSTGR